MMTSKSRKWVWATIVLVFIVGGYLWLRAYFGFTMMSPELTILANPSSGTYGDASLCGYGLVDREILLFVHSGKQDAGLKCVGRFEPFQECDVVWSRDGSILAFRFDDEFVFAHDLAAGQSIPEAEHLTSLSDRGNPETQKKIKTLLEERGRSSYCVRCTQGTFVPVKYSEWKRIRSALKVGGSRRHWL
jgi:hypothetical protein